LGLLSLRSLNISAVENGKDDQMIPMGKRG
jgi:hypothetical protein